MVTGWNIGIAGGGTIGGALLSSVGTPSLAWATLALLLIALVMVILGRRRAFPAHRTVPAGDPAPSAASSGH
jgi:predicted MFS family arabinose efflux permease